MSRREDVLLWLSAKSYSTEAQVWHIVCPVTNTDREFPFHVPVPKDSTLTGFIMVEQVKSVDFRARHAKRIECGNDELLAEVLSILDACMY